MAQPNERSLSILARAILLARGQFALILVRCNYEQLQQRMWQDLQHELTRQCESSARFREVVLPHATTTLFTTLLEAVEAEIALEQQQKPFLIPGFPDDNGNPENNGSSTSSSPPAPPCVAPGEISALMVFGLESVADLDRVLVATNQVREEFRKHFTCPIVLWATDEVLQKLTRFAPDFKNWASAAIKFELALEESMKLWWKTTDRLFRELIDAGAERFVSNAELGLAPLDRDRRELECARLDLLAAETNLSPIVEAIWAFLLGRDAYSNGQIEQALNSYQQSLDFWLQGTGYWELEIAQWSVESEELPAPQAPLTEKIANPFLEQKGLLLYHIGLCHCYQAEQQPLARRECARQARVCFSASLEIFTVKNRSHWVAQLTIQLSKVLQQLEDWSELQVLTLHSLTQSATYDSPECRARAYGFLTQVALARCNIKEAKYLALKALAIHGRAQHPLPQRESLYLLLLARAQEQLGEITAAIEHLERARAPIAPEMTAPTADEVKQTTEKEALYLEILEMLRSLYFQQRHYELAFELKQEQQLVEQTYGLRAFYGVSPLAYPNERSSASTSTHPKEILAFGRQNDVDALLERLRRSEHKLTIVHGASGVGKSSLLHAGLVPALWEEIIVAREVMPAIQTTYNDWEQGLSRAFTQALTLNRLKKGKPEEIPVCLSPADVLKSLQLHSVGNLLSVLIFDQFEEFFFHCPQSEDRQAFYQFLRDCLSIPFVKVILCLREDHLHELLTMEREMDWGVVDNDLLDRQIRYALEDLSLEAAQSAIALLTERSHFQIEEALVESFVRDIASPQGTVRPIELQVIGSALQAEKITTLQQYQQLGTDPKTMLLERWLQAAIADCGPENEERVWQVLFALTDTKGLRPLKTQAELLRAARDNGGLNRSRKEKEAVSSQQIELILKILVGSGLVSRFREESGNRYQLVHAYLVQRIRKQYNDRASRAIATQLKSNKVELVRVRKQRLQALAVGGICALLALMAAYSSWQTEAQRRLALTVSRNAELMALSSSSEALFASNQQFEALLEGLRAVKKLEESERQSARPALPAMPLPWNLSRPHSGIKTDTHLKVLTVLEQAVYGTLERNRLEGHSDVVWGVSFSPDGQRIATASLDKTVKLWHPDGRLLATLSGHQDSVTSVDMSADRTIASSSWDGTIRLWHADGTPELAIQAHRGRVYSARFSADGKRLVSAGSDGTVKIWTRQGRLLKTLSGHEGEVNWASFSPDGRFVASAGEDRTVRLWTSQGRLLKVLRGHQAQVNYVAFSPQGDAIATASEDRTVKLWSLDGRLLRTLSGHQGSVHALAFSPDGRQIASASDDNTIALWDRQGRLLKSLKGHSDRVTGVSFSADGRTLVSSSFDKTIKLWTLENRSRVVLRGHRDRVQDVTFSPDGQLVATASKDKTVKLWTRQGKLLATLNGHRDGVFAVSFSPDGQMLASASRDNTIKLWNRQGRLVKTLGGHRDWVIDVQWSPDSQILASASRDRTVKLWSRQGQLLETLKGHGDRVNAVAFSADGRLLASASDDKTIKLWQAETAGRFSLHPVKTLKGHSNWVLDVSFLPERPYGTTLPLLASASYDNTVKLWNERGRATYTLKGHTDSVAHLSFNPTGEILATTTWSNQVQLWRLDDTLLKTLEGHTDRATSVTWSQDGTALATASDDRTAIIWNLDEVQLAEKACDWLRDYIRHSSEVRNSDRTLCMQ